MKNLSKAIYAKLAGSALNTSIGGRLYKARAIADATYPYVVYTIVYVSPEKTFTEDYEDALVQFSIFSTASGTTEIEDIYTDLKALYDECSLSITGATLVWMRRTVTNFWVNDETAPTGIPQIWCYYVDYEVLESLT
jgi:hypothetical protein